MVSAPIWAVVVLVQSWLLASPGEDVRSEQALWSVRPAEQRAPYRIPAPARRAREGVPPLVLDLQWTAGAVPRDVPPIRTDELCLCGSDWSRFPGRLEPTPRVCRIPWTPTWKPLPYSGNAARLRDLEVDSYLGELTWRQPLTLWNDLGRDSATVSEAPDWTIRIDAPDHSDRLGIDERFSDGRVTWSRYIDDDPQRAFIRETLNSMGLPDGIYWNKAVFLPTGGIGNTTYWFGVSMSLKW